MTNQTIPAAQNLNLGDIYYILFRHKWKILLCALAGITAAIVLYRGESPPYQSEAKLLVRYLISNTRPSGPNPTPGETKTLTDDRGQSIMNTETEILSSGDLAEDVAKAFGPEKILTKVGGGKDLALAAAFVRSGLRVTVPPSSSVLHLSFRHPDQEIVQPVLQVIIERYLKRHVETHRASGMLTDQQAQELDSLKLSLVQAEEELRRAITNAGVVSLEGAKESLASQMTSNRREVLGYQTEVAGRLALLEELKKRQPAASPTPAATQQDPEIPQSVLDEHKKLSFRVGQLQMLEQELLGSFTSENIRVKTAQSQLADAQTALDKLRQTHPRLVKAAPTPTGQIGPDLEANEAYAAATQITVYQAKIKELDAQYEQFRTEFAKLDKSEGNILDRRRTKATAEQNYNYLRTVIESQRLNEAMQAGKVSNISSIQNPSFPFREAVNAKKAGLCAVGGILAGLAWAFLVELYLDRSVRRPSDLARMLQVPLFLSIPKLKLDEKALALDAPAKPASGDSSGSAALVPVTSRKRPKNHSLQPFHETLRDRLIGYFESRNLTHKPKLVAVTGLGQDSGVTTTAAGLARSLSETGEGNVLLVDMTVGEGAAKQFVKGREACGLDELLEARSQGHVQDNLYVVTENNNSDRLSRNMPQRFARLIPKLKASDFDYIIFDMPTVSQLSITPRLASFMDMVLLVVESETTDRDLVQGACAMLAESKAHVGVVLNKTRNYVPGRLNHEMMAT